MHNRKFALRTTALFSLFNFFILFNIFSQDVSKDVVFLKNGSVIKGEILEMTPGGNIKIETADGSVFVFAMEDVEKTSKEEIVKKRTNSGKKEIAKDAEEVPSANSFHSKGLFGVVKVGPF